MTSNQEPHVIYQPAYVQGYPTGAPVNVWNQPPNQGVTYAIPYPPTAEMGSYAEKASYGGYPPLAYQAHDNGEMMRQHHYQAQHYAQPNQWQYQQGQSHFIPTYATNFNAVTDPAYQGGPPPNMNRPPPNVKRDDFQGTIGMMENPAQSAAAYTASWVSSTSSIPPEMRDEPENADENGSGNWEGRNSGQWPSLNEENRAKNDRSGAKKTERRDEPRELTFDERLEKARMQKDRVENQGFENNGTNNTAPSTAPPAQSAPQRNNSNNNNNNNGGNNGGGSGSGNNGGSNAQNTGAVPAGAVQQTGGGIRPESSRGGGNGGPVMYNQGPPRGMPRGGPQMNGGDRRNNYRQDYQNDGRQDMGYSGYQGRGGKRGGGGNMGGGNNMPSGSGGMLPPQQQQHHLQHPQQQAPLQHQQQPYQMGLMHSGMPIQYAQPPIYAPQNHQYVLASPMTQTVDPQLLANIAALQNTHLSYSPMRRYLLPGPFGMMPQPIQQDAKFRNTWLDAQSYPPFGAMFGYDTRGRGGYRGRGGSRGGYNGGRGGGPRRYDNRRDDRRDDRDRAPPAAAPVAEEEGQENAEERDEEGATSAETGAEIEAEAGAVTENAEEESAATETDEKTVETEAETQEVSSEKEGASKEEKDLASEPEQKEAKSEEKKKET